MKVYSFSTQVAEDYVAAVALMSLVALRAHAR